MGFLPRIATNPYGDIFFGTDYRRYVGHHCTGTHNMVHWSKAILCVYILNRFRNRCKSIVGKRQIGVTWIFLKPLSILYHVQWTKGFYVSCWSFTWTMIFFQNHHCSFVINIWISKPSITVKKNGWLTVVNLQNELIQQGYLVLLI